MVASITIRLEDAGAVPALARAAAAMDDLTPLMQRIGAAVEVATQRRFETQTGPGGAPWVPSRRAAEQGGRTLSNTLRLLNSIVSEADASRAIIGSNLATPSGKSLAAIHQFGGTIVPKTAKNLAIPLTAEARRSGGPRQMQGLSFARSAEGKAFLVDEKDVFHWLLVPSVTIPARPFLGIDDADRDEIGALVADYLFEVLQ